MEVGWRGWPERKMKMSVSRRLDRLHGCRSSAAKVTVAESECSGSSAMNRSRLVHRHAGGTGEVGRGRAGVGRREEGR